MIVRESSINWHESYQNPGKNRRELGCNTIPEAIPAADRALYLDLLLQLDAPSNAVHRPPVPAHGPVC